MTGDAGDLRASNDPVDGQSLKFHPDPNDMAPVITPDLGKPSEFTNESLIAGYAARLIMHNKDPIGAVKYLIDREHAYAQEHPDDRSRYWTSITQDLTSGDGISFKQLQQVAQKEFGINNLSEKSPPTEAMYQSTLHPPKGVQDGQRIQPEHGTLRVPPLAPGEHPQTPEQPHTSEPSEAPGKILPWEI